MEAVKLVIIRYKGKAELPRPLPKHTHSPHSSLFTRAASQGVVVLTKKEEAGWGGRPYRIDL